MMLDKSQSTTKKMNLKSVKEDSNFMMLFMFYDLVRKLYMYHVIYVLDFFVPQFSLSKRMSMKMDVLNLQRRVPFFELNFWLYSYSTV